jgi:hypothetical protein
MILYHFTYPAHLKSIMETGLKAIPPGERSNDAESDDRMLGGRRAVWLIKHPVLDITDPEFIREEGYAGPTWNLWRACVCLRVKIPTRDPLLKHYNTWRNANDWPLKTPMPDYFYRNMQPDWVYFGDIPPEAISVYHIRAPGEHNPEAQAIIERDLAEAGFIVGRDGITMAADQ